MDVLDSPTSRRRLRLSEKEGQLPEVALVLAGMAAAALAAVPTVPTVP